MALTAQKLPKCRVKPAVWMAMRMIALRPGAHLTQRGEAATKVAQSSKLCCIADFQSAVRPHLEPAWSDVAPAG